MGVPLALHLPTDALCRPHADFATLSPETPCAQRLYSDSTSPDPPGHARTCHIGDDQLHAAARLTPPHLPPGLDRVAATQRQLHYCAKLHPRVTMKCLVKPGYDGKEQGNDISRTAEVNWDVAGLTLHSPVHNSLWKHRQGQTPGWKCTTAAAPGTVTCRFVPLIVRGCNRSAGTRAITRAS